MKIGMQLGYWGPHGSGLGEALRSTAHPWRGDMPILMRLLAELLT
jgi:hypothetical protein